MQVFFSVLLIVGYVTARGSGPYLPSGWKPDGPAFYLPSEVQKPAENPVKQVLFEETEPAGSDSLREYGPPKVQEVSQDISNQGLPDVITDETFFNAEKEIETAAIVLEASVAEENTEEKTQSTVEEVSIVTESQIAEEKTESQSAAILEDKAEIQTSLSLATQALQDSTIESTERNVDATVASIEAVVAELTETEQQEAITEAVTESQELSDVKEVSEVNAEFKVEVSQALETVSQEAQEIKILTDVASQQVNSVAETAQKVEAIVNEELKTLDEVKSVESIVNEGLKTLEEVKSLENIVVEEVKTLEEVKSVENIVVEEIKTASAGINNIAQVLATLESEMKAEQIQNTAEEKVAVEVAGSVAEAPEGFLEYGPPGFREYGPPKGAELLTSNDIVQDSFENNEVRRRRFSPKFRPANNPVKRTH